MLDTLNDASRWDATFSKLFTDATDGPADLVSRVQSLPLRPGRDGAQRRLLAIAQIFTVIVNARHYALATELDAATGLRKRVAAMIAGNLRLEHAIDQDALFSLAVLDTQKGGDPERARVDFARLRAMLPPEHHLQQSCADGENVATTLIGRKITAVTAPQDNRSGVHRLLSRFGIGRATANSTRQIRMVDFSATPDEALLPALDRTGLDEAALTPEQRAWRQDGVLILRDFLPTDLVDAYVARRAQLANPAGWLSPSPYQHVPEMRALALYPKLMEMQKHLLGEPMLLHLALTGWVSTERNWHQDDYLNPSDVMTWYTAVWMALDTIDPDCGPFEYIPGSHRWPLMSGEKVRSLLTPEERNRREGPQGINHWATYSERFVAPAIEAEIRAHGQAPVQFIGKKGDVLIWHSRLMHRGTAPRRPSLERRSLITHYSGVNHRSDMPNRMTDENGQPYAVFETPLY